MYLYLQLRNWRRQTSDAVSWHEQQLVSQAGGRILPASQPASHSYMFWYSFLQLQIRDAFVTHFGSTCLSPPSSPLPTLRPRHCKILCRKIETFQKSTAGEAENWNLISTLAYPLERIRRTSICVYPRDTPAAGEGPKQRRAMWAPIPTYRNIPQQREREVFEIEAIRSRRAHCLYLDENANGVRRQTHAHRRTNSFLAAVRWVFWILRMRGIQPRPPSWMEEWGKRVRNRNGLTAFCLKSRNRLL